MKEKTDISVSVIVPVFNAKRYVEACIRGLLSQTMQELEIIIVDDCSDDGSYDICLELAKRDHRISVFKQEENKGPGEARNKGIMSAKGEYITFMDCDDAIMPEALERLYETACKYHADVVHTTGCFIPTRDIMPDDLFSVGRTELVSFDQDVDPPSEISELPGELNDRFEGWLKHHYQGNVWGKLFRRSFITEHRILFGRARLSEDQIFCFSCLMQAKVYIQLPEKYNIYRIGGNSLSRGRPDKDYFIKILRSLFEASVQLTECMDCIPWFSGKNEERDRAQMYFTQGMEDLYIRPAYTRMDTDLLKKDEGMKQLFDEFFGSLAVWARHQFYTLHDSQPELPDVLTEMNDPQYWKKMKENQE